MGSGFSQDEQEERRDENVDGDEQDSDGGGVEAAAAQENEQQQRPTTTSSRAVEGSQEENNNNNNNAPDDQIYFSPLSSPDSNDNAANSNDEWAARATRIVQQQDEIIPEAHVEYDIPEALVVSATAADVDTAATRSNSFMELAARSVCPSEVTDIWCPSDVVEAVFGDDERVPDSIMNQSSPPAGVSRSDSWLPTILLPSNYHDDGDDNDDSQSRHDPVDDFVPNLSENHEWMGRSVNTLRAGYNLAAPVLAPPSPPTVRTAFSRRQSSSSNDSRQHGGTLAQLETLEHYPIDSHLQTRSQHMQQSSATKAGPNIALSLLAREMTGRSNNKAKSLLERLRGLGGETCYNAVDDPTGGMLSEVLLLEEALDRGDWAETQSIVTRLAVRLVGDGRNTETDRIDDPSLPPFASPFHAGGGRQGLERDAFVLAGGVGLLLRVFREPAFVGDQIGESNDARDLSSESVSTKLSTCWNEVLATLRELIYVLPTLVEDGIILEDGDFIPFLFTMLAHDSMFEGAAVIIEEILSIQSLVQTAARGGEAAELPIPPRLSGRPAVPSTFFLGNIPNLYDLWGGFTCRQLAHFCRILALLVFEPEDRQIYENLGVLKSMDLLQLRRDRGARDGNDATVNMNQAILVGDEAIMKRLLDLLRVMNYAPNFQRSAAAHRLTAHFPFVIETLGMVGLNEVTNWNEIDRLDTYARNTSIRNDTNRPLLVSELGNVTAMLEGLSSRLNLGDPLDPTTQLGNIIRIISAAQEAGFAAGRQRRSGSVSNDARNPIEALASVSWAWPEQVIMRRLALQGDGGGGDDANGAVQVVGLGIDRTNGEPAVHHLHTDDNTSRSRILSSQDAANELQFNAFVLAPYQVEVLFVLCTLLGGRRKIDTQNLVRKFGIADILDEMFHRLSWRRVSSSSSGGDEPQGIHGPGCECTPESALCTQYLRLIHNFCDRDCDNYTARRLMLSSAERRYIFEEDTPLDECEMQPGLLMKVMQKLMTEPDDSPYRFWLASCVESYLRGSAPREQLFVAEAGLLDYLVDDVISDRLHCAGSLQTSFDLLGELCKGNEGVLRLLTTSFDEHRFRRLMDTASSNLIDSNVFLRSILLTIEMMRLAANMKSLEVLQRPSRSYLTHSWWDMPMMSLSPDEVPGTLSALDIQQMRSADWFPPRDTMLISDATLTTSGLGLSPMALMDLGAGWLYGDAVFPPNTVERLSWFLNVNKARLLRDLLSVVDLRNINHENICCLNTAIIVNLLANRRNQLPQLLDELRALVRQERIESGQREMHIAETINLQAETEGISSQRALMQSMDRLDLDHSGRRRRSAGDEASTTGSDDQIDVMTNFRQLLWFWNQYYSHRGRDRLSLEFSSRLRYDEWRDVVTKLTADDGSRTSLVSMPVRLPRSPYKRKAQLDDSPTRAR